MIYVNLMSITFLVLIFIISKNYNIDDTKALDSKKHPLKALYPMGLYFMDKVTNRIFPHSHKANERKVVVALEAVYLREKSNNIARIYQCKKMAMIIIIVFATNVLSLVTYLNGSNDKNDIIEGNFLMRRDYGEGDSSATLHVKVGDGDAPLLEEDMELIINERELTAEEINRLLEDGSAYLDTIILLENEDANAIRTDLFFPTTIPSKGIRLTWFTEDKNVIDAKGRVCNDQLEYPKLVWVKAVLKLRDREATHTRYFKVYPKEYTKQEMIKKQLLEEIEKKKEEALTKNKIELPTKIGQEMVTWSLVKKSESAGLLILGLLAAGLIYFFMDKDLWNKVDKRNKEMLLDYPDIINKFTLLVDAGMSLSNAWSKIAKDYTLESAQFKYAYEEMNITARELEVGISEITAYERFGRRVQLLPYLRFSSFLARNVEKGSKDLLELLEAESIEAFEERKELAKRLGEEAGTKLLLPMMLMFVIVLAIILVPAFSSFQF